MYQFYDTVQEINQIVEKQSKEFRLVDLILNRNLEKSQKYQPLTQNCKSRITVITDATQLFTDTFHQEDLVAVRPTNEKAFLAACTQWDIDIISLDLTQLLPFRLKFATVGQAIARGIYFEIQYSHLFSSPNNRKNWISNAAALVRASHGKNLIISSGAESAIHMRSPADIANLSILFGLNPQLAKDSMSKHVKSALLHAETRKTYRGSIKRKCDTPAENIDKKVKEMKPC